MGCSVVRCAGVGRSLQYPHTVCVNDADIAPHALVGLQPAPRPVTHRIAACAVRLYAHADSPVAGVTNPSVAQWRAAGSLVRAPGRAGQEFNYSGGRGASHRESYVS